MNDTDIIALAIYDMEFGVVIIYPEEIKTTR
jgi:hypothetical protein